MNSPYLKSPAQRMFAAMLLALGALCHSQASAVGAAATQSRESYEAAIHNGSTAPSYVLISLSDSETGDTKPLCKTANFLLDAIHVEYALGYDTGASSKAVQTALESQDHSFRFHPAALANIPVRYSDKDLAAARAFLGSYSGEELKTKFASLYRESRLPLDGYARDAIACVLIERGLSPTLADRSGQVYIDR